MKPEEGGKFQYSLSIVEALKAINNQKYLVTALYHDNNWEKYIPYNFTKVKIENKNLGYKIITKILHLLPFRLHLLRIAGKYLDPVQNRLFKLKPHLVFYPGCDSFIYEARLPGIVPVFDLMHRYEPTFPEVAQEEIYRAREYHYKNICKYAKAILVDSKSGRQHLLECYKVNKKKIFVLPYIAPSYVRDKGPITDIRSKYKLPERYIFYPAQFWKHKNHNGLLSAVSILQSQNIIVNVVFVGSNKNAGDSIRGLIDRLNLNEQIYILDFVPIEDLVALYKKAVALVMPTFLGPTNIPQLEAFALGCPVITSDIYGIPTQVGDAALLINPNDNNDIADKIGLLWCDDNVRQELVQKGFRKDMEWSQKAFNLKLFFLIDNILN